jgi:hypothetical protein
VTASAGSEAAAARVAAFSAAAALSITQDIVRAIRPALGDGADEAVVAEETLSLVATVTARSVEAGLGGDTPVGAAVAEVPMLYHDYLLGTELVSAGASGDVEVDQSVYERLGRKASFYATHLPPGRPAGPDALARVLPLWMGRVSPPGLPTSPDRRLADTGVARMLEIHGRLVLAFAQRAAAGG